MTNELILNELNPIDIVCMETAHSTYRFAVLDPTARAGILSGGLLNETPLEANFLCSLSAQENGGDDTTRIKVGSRAIFIYTSEARARYIVISTITKLTYNSYRTDEKTSQGKNISADDRFCSSFPH